MKSIRWRLVVLYVTLISIVMILCGTFIIYLIKTKSLDDIQVELKQVVESRVSNLQLRNIPVEDYQQVADKIEDIHKNTLEEKTYDLALKVIGGKMIYPKHTDSDKYNNLFNRMNSDSDIQAIEQGRKLNGLIRNQNQVDGKIEDMAGYSERVDINGDDVMDYVIYVETSLNQVNENIGEYIRIIVISVMISVVISTLLGLLFASTITKPIIALTKKAKKLSQGEFIDEHNQIPVQSEDEIGQLTETFNSMAIELSNTMSEITSEKNKLETVFAYMADGILVFNSKDEVHHANPAAYSMLGFGINQQNFEEIFSELHHEIDFDSLMDMDTNSIRNFMCAVRDKYLNACFATYVDKSNNSKGLITVLQDITEQKKLEEMQKEFVANVSHELRTPLTTIKTYTETLLDGALDDRDTSEHFLQVVNHESDRMTMLVQDLLELSRLDNKQIKFSMNKVNLTDLIIQCYEKYKILADKKEQEMTFDIPEKAFSIMADTHRIEQVVKNIISNAVKYSPEGAKITLGLKQHFDMVQISIKDTGMGIPEEDIARIFERFYRVDKARSRAMGGTGLGLAITKEIVEHHGGEIFVESTYGEGSIFYINLPLYDVI